MLLFRLVIVINPINSSTSSEGKWIADSSNRRHGRTTLADVADLAGVTAMTVSRYLRMPQSVSAKTAQRIAHALAESAYRPNKQAGLLASGRSQIVAAIIPNLGNSIFAETIQGISDTLHGHGLELLLASTNYSLEREEEQIRAVLGWAPAALIVTGRTHSAGALALMRQAKATGMPVVEMWDQSATRSEAEFAQVGFNHAAVGRLMAMHLLARGFQSLVYIDSSVAQDFRAHARGEGFVQTGRARGAQVQLVQAGAGQGLSNDHPTTTEPMQAGRLAMRSLLAAQQSAPRAVAFANDQLCAGAFLEATERGIRIPQDWAFLGFGDFPISRELGLNADTGQRGFSTVQVQRSKIGIHSAEAVLRALGLSAGSDVAQTIEPVVLQRTTS